MFTITKDSRNDSTQVSNLFIDAYMAPANDAQLKVYLYLLRCVSSGLETGVSDLADRFNHTDKDILRALFYWEKQGLVRLSFDSQGSLAGIHMLSPGAEPAGTPDAVRPAALPAAAQTSVVIRDQRPAAAASAAPKKNCSPSALAAFREDAARAQLLFIAEQYIGKPLSVREIETIYYMSEQLRFSDALIDYLIQYCVDRGKKDFRYIEKVAVSWAEHGITTPKQAERSLSSLAGKGRKGRGGQKPSANPFNQFEQHDYDFDEIERILTSD